MRENLVPIAVATVIVGGILYLASPGDRPAVAPAGSPARGPAAVGQTTALAPTPVLPQQTAQAPSAPPAAPARTAPPQATHDHQSSAVAQAEPPRAQTPPSPAAPQTVVQAPASLAPQTGASPGGDPQAGRLVYRKCQACHSLEPGKNTLGPSLAGILGKKAAEVPNFNYSPALKASNIVWDVAALDAYLLDPQKTVPGNKMPFPGLKTENERRDVIAYLAASSPPGGPQVAQQQQAPVTPPAAAPQAQSASSAAAPAQPPAEQVTRPSVSYIPDARYTLRSGIAEGRMVFLGVGGTIDGQVNPLLSAAEGQVVQIILINGEGAEHDIVFPEQDARSPRITGRGASTSVVFRATRSGDFTYICSVPGHQLAGMQGQFVVTPRPPAQVVVEADISQKSTEVPPAIGNRPPQTVRVDLIAVELEGRLAEGTTFGYWTFNGKVPAQCCAFASATRSMFTSRTPLIAA